MKTLLVKLMIWVLRRDFGADCIDYDWECFDDDPYQLLMMSRCQSCAAAEVIEWLEKRYLDVD